MNTPSTSNRVLRSLTRRVQAAARDASIAAPPQTDNGDEAKYADKCGTYTKGILQSGLGLVDLSAYATFRKAIDSGLPADFEAITIGPGGRSQNGPQGGLAYSLECVDSSQFHVPPAPPLASDLYATELVELYWASLLRDVAFVNYSSNAVAGKAATELSSLPQYQGPKSGGKVTPDLLFRGNFPGETTGPYISQFLALPTSLGALSIDQKYATLPANKDYMLDAASFQAVQNGMKPPKLTTGAPAYLHDGRGFASYTHVDVLYEAYFIAYLILSGLSGMDPTVINPGNPYNTSKTQNGFGTFGQPDFASVLTTVAGLAINAVWYFKWFVHLRHRPESGGGVVYLEKTGQGNTILGKLSNVVLNSQAVQSAFASNNSYFLSQAFPEGSPTHPAYPTGHGAVAGACITVLKFFFNGDYAIPNPMLSSSDGGSLNKYTGSPLTVNGELHKLAHNISFGHGIHAGIHWRSDSDTSIQLGEAVAISYLKDRAHTYNEKFSVSFTKLDGTQETIAN